MALLLTTGSAWAFDPPRIIGELRGEPPELFGEQYCWVGDQNGDGFDELLVGHDPAYFEGHVNRVYLYFGGERMDNAPDFTFRPFEPGGFGFQIAYLGNLGGGSDKWILIQSSYATNNQPHAIRDLFYKGGRELDSIPDLVMSSRLATGYLYGTTLTTSPADFNNDGYDDWLTWYHAGDQYFYLKMFMGGAEFDTVADWSVFVVHGDERYSPIGPFYKGNFNSDDYKDFFVVVEEPGSRHRIDLYYGGDPMDTVAAYSWSLNEFNESIAPRDVSYEKFAVLPDINGDGYDDWAIQWAEGRQGWDESGFYVFFGSENPDFEPDLDLDDNHSNDTEGQIGGSDFNGDGLGDIMTTHTTVGEGGEIQFYFGSRQMSPDASLTIDVMESFGRFITPHNIGAIGDYNGDHVKDFVGKNGPVFIFSHGEDWVNSVVPDNPIPITPFLIEIFPNPFNQSLSLTVESPVSGNYSISILNIDGRLMSKDSLETVQGGSFKHELSTSNLPAGIYFIRCLNKSNGVQQLKKAVLLR